MFEAQLLMADINNDVEVFSPWFPRGGDNALFTLDLVQSDEAGTASLQLEVKAFTKNLEVPGDGADSISGTRITVTSSDTRKSETWLSTSSSGFDELVRYKFILSATGDDGAVWVLFRMLPPSWFDSVGG